MLHYVDTKQGDAMLMILSYLLDLKSQNIQATKHGPI